MPFKIFSVSDARKAFPGFDSKRLVEWQQKGYLEKLINKWYLFSAVHVNEHLLYWMSNCLYRPSYISLESALSFYNLIPEAVYTRQAVSTRKTTTYETTAGIFNYRTIKPALYFGYRILNHEELPVLMAEIEKALLDYLYLNASIETMEDMTGLRLNKEILETQLDWDKFMLYAGVFNNQRLNKRINLLKQMM